MCKLVNITTNMNTNVAVSEFKQNQILWIIKLAAICREIDQIILFGSSLNENCKEESDIDFVVISKLSSSSLSQRKDYKEFLKRLYMSDDFHSEYDILYFKSLDEISNNKKDQICREIYDKGKLIYDKRGAA